ncbi:MAG: CDP-alcohol-phosphatidyltransferase [Dehalococcoidales bacterium]|nr:CDP-alcohol-phosphatidyltransferase [Dehalococcoidales bacterium]
MTRLPELRKNLAYHLSQPVVRLLAMTPITPNALSWFGFVVTIGAAILIVSGHIFAAGFVVLLAGFFDILDGALARSTERITTFGGILDSTLDRLAEAVLLLGILAKYAAEPSVTGVLLVGLALVGSLLVSYIRARAEAANLECQEGLFTRAERVVVLALGLLLNQLLLVLAIIALLSFITAGQRLVHAWQQTKNK